MNIYVAASSQELERAGAVMNLIKAYPGLHLTHDWVSTINQVRNVEQIADGDLGERERFLHAKNDLAAIHQALVRDDSGLFWLLTPQKHTSGAWVEFGYALARAQTMRALGGTQNVICSGPGHEHYIFCSMASEKCFETDSDAWRWVLEQNAKLER